jgi:hypothetical protein
LLFRGAVKGLRHNQAEMHNKPLPLRGKNSWCLWKRCRRRTLGHYGKPAEMRSQPTALCSEPPRPPRRAGQNPITLVSVGSLPVVTLLIIAAVVMAGLGYSSGLREAVRRGFDRAFCPNLTVYAG